MGPAKRVRSDEDGEPAKRAAFGAASGASAGAANGTGEARRGELLAHVKALNSQFIAWVNAKSVSAPNELWSAGVLDYARHAEKIRSDFRDVLASTDSSPSHATGAAAPQPDEGRGAGAAGASDQARPSAFSWQKADDNASESEGAKVSAPLMTRSGTPLSFGGAAVSTTAEASGGKASFPAPSAANKDTGDAKEQGKSLFSFGSTSGDQGGEKKAFTFGTTGGGAGSPTPFAFPSSSANRDAGKDASKPSPFNFQSSGANGGFGGGLGGFNVSGPVSFGWLGNANKKSEEADEDGGEGDGEEGDEEAEKEEQKSKRVRVEEEPEDPENENLFQAKAKYYIKNKTDNEWCEVALGLVVVKRPKAGGKPFLIFRKIEGGRVVLNTPVYDNMKFLCTPDQPGKGVGTVFIRDTVGEKTKMEQRTVLFRMKPEKLHGLNKVLETK